jgi:hypothetical protein
MQALKGENNMKGLEQIEALRKHDDISNNSLKTFSTPQESTPQENRQVTFNQATQPPKETAPNLTETTTSKWTQTTTPITAVITINKPIMNTPTPRVHTKQSTRTNAMPTPKMINQARNEMRDKLRDHLRSK